MALRLKLGSGVEFCALAPPKFPPSSNDTTSKYVGGANVAAPAICPALP